MSTPATGNPATGNRPTAREPRNRKARLAALAVAAATVVALPAAGMSPATAAPSHRAEAQPAATANRAATPIDAATAATAVAPATAGSTADVQGKLSTKNETLSTGTPAQAGLLASYADKIPADAASGIAAGTGVDGHPLYPGEVVLAARNGVIAEYAAAGDNLRYADQQGTELPVDQRIPTTKDTIYDLASLSKLFTAIVTMQQIEKGAIDLNAPVVDYLPEFAANGKSTITIRNLLTHTSGLPADPSPGLWTYPTYAQRIQAIENTVPDMGPNQEYLYSDLNFMTLQLVDEAVSGKPLDALVRDGITAPLGMTDTMYNPPASLKPRIAAEEYELTPDRGLVWGQVHDENSWALNGVAGHAGVFSTAYDLAILCQTMINGGEYGSAHILSRHSVAVMLTNYNQAFPGQNNGLGFELYQHWYMGALATPYTMGHTGFTGTTLVADPTSDSFVIFLTNHVHPNRNWGSTNAPRRAVADDLSRAIAVHPRAGRTDFYSGMADKSTATLSVPVTIPAGTPARLAFDLYYDTEPGSDFLYLESSTDGTTWKPVPFRLSGRGAPSGTQSSVSGYDGRSWERATADLTGLSGPVTLRWRYTTDPLYHGRGAYVDGVRVTAGSATLLDGERTPGAFTSVGWNVSSD